MLTLLLFEKYIVSKLNPTTPVRPILQTMGQPEVLTKPTDTFTGQEW